MIANMARILTARWLRIFAAAPALAKALLTMARCD
jgi:hypothetical protein